VALPDLRDKSSVRHQLHGLLGKGGPIDLAFIDLDAFAIDTGGRNPGYEIVETSAMGPSQLD